MDRFENRVVCLNNAVNYCERLCDESDESQSVRGQERRGEERREEESTLKFSRITNVIIPFSHFTIHYLFSKENKNNL
jgi:hypothetical protein